MATKAHGKEHPNKQDYWNSELRSLGIEPKRKNDLNDNDELSNLTENMKQTMFQDYKTAYNPDKQVDESQFDYLI
jgi:hypothetical protein